MENLQKWRFTWEAQSHIPTLRLFLFDSRTNPSLQCRNLQVHVNLSQSLVLVSWSDDVAKTSLRVPIPRVLVDSESPVNFRAFDDHIEVKLILLLPVGHSLVSNLDSIFNSSGDAEAAVSNSSKSLSVDSDIKSLITCGAVSFYCKNCKFNLARSPLRNFAEMPSVNWREVADNWFGACCCSFGGISEKLVTRFANSYTCSKGVCLLSFATITVCKDDLVECNFPNSSKGLSHKTGPDLSCEPEFGESTLNSNPCNEKSSFGKLEDEEVGADVVCVVSEEESNIDRLYNLRLQSDSSGKDDLAKGCCAHHVSEAHTENQKRGQSMEILENQKPFLNGFLENIFMVKSSNLSADVEWVEYLCPHCSTLLGAYPCGNGFAPVDGGVRLFKCYISTSLPVGGSEDLFRLVCVRKKMHFFSFS